MVLVFIFWGNNLELCLLFLADDFEVNPLFFEQERLGEGFRVRGVNGYFV